MARPREFSATDAVGAAMELFWSKGYEATSTQDLCERTGLGRGSLYNAFGSKHQLYTEALRRYAEVGFEAQLRILAGPGSARERLRALMFRVIEDDLADPEHRGCLAINAAVEAAGRDEAVRETVRAQFLRLEQAIRAVVEQGHAAGEFTAEAAEPAQAARSLLSSYYGLRVLGKVVGDREMLIDVVDGALARL
jgi:TetR/AcrR family transcriptional regulator, transcriptional repressor for nem operon